MKDIYKNIEIVNKELKILELQMSICNLKNNKQEYEIKKEQINDKIKEKNNLLNGVDNNDEYINKLIFGDCMDHLSKMQHESIDLMLSDIPYGINLDEWDVLHNNTNNHLLKSSPAQAGKKAFKRRGKPINGWNNADKKINDQYEEWCNKWAVMLFAIMKEGAPVFIFGGRRTIHRALTSLENAGFLVKDILVWKKQKAHHRSQDICKVLAKRGKFSISEEKIIDIEVATGNSNLKKLRGLVGKSFDSYRPFIEEILVLYPELVKSKYLILEICAEDLVKQQIEMWKGWKLGNLAPMYEPIAWVFKPYSTETLTDNILKNNVGAMNMNECKINGKSPTNILEFSFEEEELKSKLHEAQKPVALMEYLIKLVTRPGQTVLDPFVGSGTTALAARNLGRNYIAFESNKQNYENAKKRLEQN